MRMPFNPYLPEGEYIPDAEPHVFGNRVYVYGSHDQFNSCRYCPGNYVVWSAPAEDLSRWSTNGVAYRRRGVGNPLGLRCMWAPDCAAGGDGRYYLYYCFNFDNRICVAVAQKPDGPFAFYGYVRHADGTLYGRADTDILCFDPGVFRDDDGQIYLYSGYSANEDLRRMLRWKGIRNADGTGNQVMRLDKDMLTIIGKPRMLIPGYKNSEGTGFAGHEMYEASSMRKINGKYYCIYSTRQSHELAYAVSAKPDEGFTFGGVIVSNGNIGYRGRSREDATYYWGNNHGSVENIHGQWYVFYHRQTNKTEQSRQGCAEPIEVRPDGSIPQVEMTSQGLYGKPLPGHGTYPSYIACHLTSKTGAVKCSYGILARHRYRMHPCITQYARRKQCIRGMRDGATAGFRYFALPPNFLLTVSVRGSAGKLVVRTDPASLPICVIALEQSGSWAEFSSIATGVTGTAPLFFTYLGSGKIDFLSFRLGGSAR